MEKQRTLGDMVECAGVGLHSGTRVRLRLCPAGAGEGVVFVRTDLPGRPEIPALIENVVPNALMRQTTLAAPTDPTTCVGTVEHILAALHGFGIDNCRAEMDGPEAPIFDGSALDLAEGIARTGAVEQDAPRRWFCLKGPVALTEGDVELIAMPSDWSDWSDPSDPSESPGHLRLTFFVDYPGTMIGKQALSLVVTPESFRTEIAPARTFALKEEILPLWQRGLIKGGSLDSALVVDGDHLYNPGATLRFEDEFVRHKLLDLLGDLYLLGRPLRAHVMAVRSGHGSHAKFVAKIREMEEARL